jgi:hypothetical protein
MAILYDLKEVREERGFTKRFRREVLSGGVLS